MRKSIKVLLTFLCVLMVPVVAGVCKVLIEDDSVRQLACIMLGMPLGLAVAEIWAR